MAKPARYAAIDVGSNTIHLLMASCTPPAPPRQLLRRREFVQLGRDVAAAGLIGPARMERAARTLQGQVEEARGAGARALAVGATEALRSAQNGLMVAKVLASRANLDAVRILPAQVEAQLAFDGSTKSLRVGVASLMLDIGGASSQVAFGPAGGLCLDHSLPIGSGTVTAAAVSDPPTDEEWRAMERLVAESMPDLVPPPPGTLGLGTGGTITNLPRLLGRDKDAVLRPRDVEEVIELFRVTPVATLAARFRMDLERVWICRGGALILAQLMDLLQLPKLRCSERGLRDGMVMALAQRGEDWWRSSGWDGEEPAPSELMSANA